MKIKVIKPATGSISPRKPCPWLIDRAHDEGK